MKLYTEEQVRQIFENLSVSSGYDYNMETYCDSITPIELPSEEDIDQEASTIFIFGADQGKFIAGAKWMKEQILKNK